MQPSENKPVGIFPYLVAAMLMSSSSASAYSVDIKSSENLEVSSSLQKYELAILKKIGETLKGFNVPQKGAIKVTISEKGSFTNITFLSPRPEKSVREKIKSKINSLPLEKIPGANGSTSLTLECEIPELNSSNPFRSGTNIGAGIPISRLPMPVDTKRDMVAYTDKDRAFDQSIKSLYQDYYLLDAMSKRKTRRIRKDLDKETILKEAKKSVSEKCFYSASLLYALLARENSSKENSLFLDKALEYGDKLSKAQKVSLAAFMITMASGSNRLLERAKTFIENENLDDTFLKIELEKALIDRYSESDSDKRLSSYKKIVSLSMESKPLDPRMTSKAFLLYIKELVKEKRFDEAKAILNEAIDFQGSHFGKNDISMVPFLILSLQSTDDEKMSTDTLARLMDLIDEYVSPIRFSVASIYASTNSEMALRYMTGFLMKFAKPSKELSPLENTIASEIARGSLKLSIKIHGFDYTTFQRVANYFQKSNRQEQLLNLYRETIDFLANSPVQSLYLQKLTYIYERQLNEYSKLDPASKSKSVIAFEQLYESKKKQLSNQETVSESTLNDLIKMALKRESFKDAADFQKIYLDKTQDKNRERADLKFIELMNLCKYLILAGQEKEAGKIYKEALSLEKDESFNNRRTRHENYFADVASAWAEAGYLNEADGAMRKSIDYEKPTPRGNKRFTNTIKALNTLLEKYEAGKEFEKASKLLEYKVSKSQPDDKISLWLKLAFLQLSASKEDPGDKTTWLKRSRNNFDLAIKAIESLNGADSYSYKNAIRKWVERLDKNGYEEEANAQEKLLD